MRSVYEGCINSLPMKTVYDLIMYGFIIYITLVIDVCEVNFSNSQRSVSPP